VKGSQVEGVGLAGAGRTCATTMGRGSNVPDWPQTRGEDSGPGQPWSAGAAAAATLDPQNASTTTASIAARPRRVTRVATRRVITFSPLTSRSSYQIRAGAISPTAAGEEKRGRGEAPVTAPRTTRVGTTRSGSGKTLLTGFTARRADSRRHAPILETFRNEVREGVENPIRVDGCERRHALLDLCDGRSG